ncbi:MAG: carboxypeptidase-like regulatory domain-containing protein, partial [Sinomicrobium sp.]|nr:carboxypeptidase-like regulatory domain-containing protein [Sinomicrobium sp.]
MKNNWLAACIICCSVFAYGQNTIQGSVHNAENETPVSLANVYLPQLEKGAVTDSTGVFEMNGLPDGTFKIVVSSLGYRTWSDNVILPLQQPLRIALTPHAIEMEEIIVST